MGYTIVSGNKPSSVNDVTSMTHRLDYIDNTMADAKQATKKGSCCVVFLCNNTAADGVSLLWRMTSMLGKASPLSGLHSVNYSMRFRTARDQISGTNVWSLTLGRCVNW